MLVPCRLRGEGERGSKERQKTRGGERGSKERQRTMGGGGESKENSPDNVGLLSRSLNGRFVVQGIMCKTS